VTIQKEANVKGKLFDWFIAVPLIVALAICESCDTWKEGKEQV
jgi:hypothetical protein